MTQLLVKLEQRKGPCNFVQRQRLEGKENSCQKVLSIVNLLTVERNMIMNPANMGML